MNSTIPGLQPQSPQRTKILVMGNVVADIVARPVEEVPKTGSLHPEVVEFHPGGCAGNVALVASRLGAQVQLVACVGKDALGMALRSGWESAGIDTSLVRQAPGVATGITIVLVDSGGERRFISSPGANRQLRPAMVPEEALEDAFALHIGGFFAAPGIEDGTLAPRLADARERGVLTTLDMVGGSARERRANLYPLLPHLDMVLLNEDEGEKVTGERDPEAIVRTLLAAGARTVLFKQGAAGCLVADGNNRDIVPAFPATCLDSTGAGDAFVATLLVALAWRLPLEEALRWASAAGAATVEGLGATGVWEGWEELDAVTKRV